MDSNDLTRRQLKRIGRIDERNPARAARVADRMEKRGARVERGKSVVDRNSVVGPQSSRRQISEANMRMREFRPDTPLAETPKIKGY